MKNILLIISLVLLLNIGLVLAHEHSIDETKGLISSGISCEKLTDGQLEAVGEYYMEQMHPGEAHELMDRMMGGEGSESLRQMHIQMAKNLYCNESGGMMGNGMMGSGSMMGMMPMMMGMIGSRMMSNYPNYQLGYGNSNSAYRNIFLALLLAAAIFLIAWLVYNSGVKKAASETPLNILKERYAKGEITKKEFDSMKKDIVV